MSSQPTRAKSNPVVEILSQGDEVICGQVTDTNAAWLAQELTQLGCRVKRHSSVGDCLADIVTLLGDIAARVDVCLCTGGLGPTTDDLTTEAVSRAFGLPLELDPIALDAIKTRMSGQGRTMQPFNQKQAYLPQGAERLDNLWGTAPGFTVHHQGCWFIFMPGVPREMRGMFGQWVKSRLMAAYSLSSPRWTTFRTVGVGESTLQERMNTLTLPDGVQVGFWAAETEVHVKLRFADCIRERDREEWVKATRLVLQPFVYGIDSETHSSGSLPEIVQRLLNERDMTLLVLDAVSGGAIAASLVGESRLRGAVVAGDVNRLSALLGYSGNDPAQLAAWVRHHHQPDCVLLCTWQISPDTDESDGEGLLRCVVVQGEAAVVLDDPLPAWFKQYPARVAALCLDSLRQCLED